MNINKVSYGLLGVALTAGVLTGCSETKYSDKAKEGATKYLNGDELLRAERYAHKQMNYDKYDGEAVVYWDSLLIEAKAKEAYQKGYQLVKDSLNGVHHRKEKFKAPLDTIVYREDFVDDIKAEYAKYVSARDFIKDRNNAPDTYHLAFKNDLAGSTHYWNLITMSGRQKEAYNQGMADARKELIKK